jgi:hypothetical protein
MKNFAITVLVALNVSSLALAAGTATNLSPEAIDLGKVLLREAKTIQEKLDDTGLSRAFVQSGTVEEKNPLGADHRIFRFELSECGPTTTTPCSKVGTLVIHENVFLRPGQMVFTYDVEVSSIQADSK